MISKATFAPAGLRNAIGLQRPPTADLLWVLIRPVQFALYFLSGLVPRKPTRWVFGSWNGKRYADNAAALFEHCARRPGNGIDAIWIASSRPVLRRVRERGLRAHLLWSPRGLHACLTAGVYVFVSTTQDINHWTSRGARLVLLRHGVGIKKIGRSHTNPSHRQHRLYHGTRMQRALWRFLLPWHSVRSDLVIATSPLHAEQAYEYFGVGPERVEITGFPRCDVLFHPERPQVDSALDAWIRDLESRGAHLFFYMPTFRDDGSPPFVFPWEELDRRLGELGARMLVRTHFDDRSGFARRLGQLRLANIRLHEPHADPYAIFPAVRSLITDYSSVAYDFMLLRRPVIFFTSDQQSFQQMRSLYFDYDEVTPGLRARTLGELVDAMAAAVEGRGDPHAAARDQLMDRFHSYREGGSCERVYAAVHRRFVDGAGGRA